MLGGITAIYTATICLQQGLKDRGPECPETRKKNKDRVDTSLLKMNYFEIASRVPKPLPG
jgi:hypothetical protein